MLDKSIPYYNIIMRRESGTHLPEVILPEGFVFTGFSEGDAHHWAEIETSVGEFDSTEEAKYYFEAEYLPYMKELERRLLFIQTDKGEKVATYTIWWNYLEDLRVPSVHWVAVKPGYQGLGLGKAVVFEGMKKSIGIEGDTDMYLHTQTWSYKAIGIYISAGFRFIKTGSFEKYGNDYEKAIPVIKEKMEEDLSRTSLHKLLTSV